MSLKISKSQINTMLLYASAVLILIKMLTRLNNGAWELSYANVYTYNFYGSNLYGEANDWSLYILLFFFIINAKDCLLRQKDFFYVIICIGSFAFWTVIELMKGSGNYVFRGSIPTTLCLIPLFFLYGSARGVREQIKNLSAFLTIGFLAITVISSIQTYGSLGYGVRILSSPAKDSLSVAMLSLWVYVFADTANNVRKREYYFKIILISIATVCSIAIISRSWTIQCFILLVAYMLVSSEDSTQFTRVIKISIVVGVLLLVLSLNFENLINSLLGRVGEDTRSGQYEQFFSQVKMTSLIFGNGMNATYKFNGQKYSYFDNQIIFTSFHYGIVSFFVLAIFLLRVILCRVKDCYNNIMRKELVQKKIVTVLLVAALCGLSVYLKYDWTVPWALILIYLGSYEQNSI